MSLQFLIALFNNFLEYTVIKCPIETAAIAPSLTILLIDRHESLYFNVEALIIHKFVHEHSKGKQIANKW